MDLFNFADTRVYFADSVAGTTAEVILAQWIQGVTQRIAGPIGPSDDDGGGSSCTILSESDFDDSVNTSAKACSRFESAALLAVRLLFTNRGISRLAIRNRQSLVAKSGSQAIRS